MPSSEVFLGKPDAGNLHVRFEEGGGGADLFFEPVTAPPLLYFNVLTSSAPLRTPRGIDDFYGALNSVSNSMSLRTRIPC